MNTNQPQYAEHLDTVVIGAGQAGLATGYHLARQGRNFVILDANDRVGDNWRCHWDSLRLYSPAVHDGLPGLNFPGSAFSFPTRDEVADYLQTYAKTFDLPVRHGAQVQRLTRNGGRYVVECSDATFQADNVVVATGTFGRTPKVPEIGADLDPLIVQLHSSEYHNPSQLQEGPVLVVGASHSGADIAIEVAASRSTILCGRDTGQIPVRPETRRFRMVFPIVWQAWGHVQSVRNPIGRKRKEYVRRHGAPLLRVKRSDVASAGIERVTDRMTGVRDGLPVLGEGRMVDVVNVIWCTGFRHDFSWIELPVIGDDGWPLEERGVVPASPGLYFTGLSFQSSFRSMLIGGAGADAAYIVNYLASHRTDSGAVTAAA